MADVHRYSAQIKRKINAKNGGFLIMVPLSNLTKVAEEKRNCLLKKCREEHMCKPVEIIKQLCLCIISSLFVIFNSREFNGTVLQLLTAIINSMIFVFL
jgi:hypothetical protein